MRQGTTLKSSTKTSRPLTTKTTWQFSVLPIPRVLFRLQAGISCEHAGESTSGPRNRRGHLEVGEQPRTAIEVSTDLRITPSFLIERARSAGDLTQFLTVDGHFTARILPPSPKSTSKQHADGRGHRGGRLQTSLDSLVSFGHEISTGDISCRRKRPKEHINPS